MSMIQAKVNPRLLTKASRLFTGTLRGRIIEILQNARRAGAKHVVITNQGGTVTVRDDGRGIRDFQNLLDLGGSDWEQSLEASEDPAGVGLFCMAPRPLTIRSHGHKAIIDTSGWTGSPVDVLADPLPLPILPPDIAGGTELSFADDPWNESAVIPCAVFTGLDVTVDGMPCPKEQFISDGGTHYPQLGCRIKVITAAEITEHHRKASLGHDYGDNVCLNFHGQVVAFGHHPTSQHELNFMVDMTGHPTGIRLLLPARTCLVENEAYAQLKAALEREAFLYLKGQGQHRLPYSEYLRARELGIELPEAQPTYNVGLLHSELSPEPVEVVMPKGHALAQCYRLADTEDREDSDEANVHILAALGQFDAPFVPVEISTAYDGYSWAKLPTIGRVEVTAGKVMQETWIGSGQLICVDSLAIAVRCSDGKTFRSIVCMAVKPAEPDRKDRWLGDEVYVTPAAERELAARLIWYHLGGFSDDGDTYDTQEEQFSQELDAFWQQLVGPHESLRVQFMAATGTLTKGWRQVTIRPNGKVVILHKDKSEQVLAPPRNAE